MLTIWKLAAMGAAGFMIALASQAGTARAMQGFGVSPTSQEVSLNPGEKATGEITIINDGDNDVPYKLYAADYKVTSEDYRGNFTDQKAAANVSPITWFSLPAGTFVSKARSQVKVPYTITVPNNATIGGHYGAVFAETIPQIPKNGSAVARVDRVGSLFYLAIGGEAQPKGYVKELSASWLQALAPITGTLRLVNNGNSHYSADVTAQLESPFGKVGKPQQLRGEVLPSTTRKFDLELSPGSPIGLYNLKVSVNYLGRVDHVNHWVLLMPRLTFIILSSTILLILAIVAWSAWRRLGRLRRRAS